MGVCSPHSPNPSLLLSSSIALLVLSMATTIETKLTINGVDTEQQWDDAQRAQWPQAAVLGANDGLVSIASLMTGIGAVKDDPRAMLLSGFASLVAGACSMTIGEFVSVCSQLDTEIAQRKREHGTFSAGDEDDLPRPIRAAMASGMGFIVGVVVPLVAAAHISNYKIMMGVVAAAASMTLVAFGSIGAWLHRARIVRPHVSVLIGGWAATTVAFGLVKLVGSRGIWVRVYMSLFMAGAPATIVRSMGTFLGSAPTVEGESS